MILPYYLYDMKGNKKKERVVRENFSYVAFREIVEVARKKAANEVPFKTLSSKIEELLIQYNNSK